MENKLEVILSTVENLERLVMDQERSSELNHNTVARSISANTESITQKIDRSVQRLQTQVLYQLVTQDLKCASPRHKPMVD